MKLIRFTLFLLVKLLLGGCDGEGNPITHLFSGVSTIRVTGGTCDSYLYELSVPDRTLKGSYSFLYSTPYLRHLSCVGDQWRTYVLEQPTPIPVEMWNKVVTLLSEWERVEYVPSQPGNPYSCGGNPSGVEWGGIAMQLDDSPWFTTSLWACQALVIPPGNNVQDELKKLFDSLNPVLKCYGDENQEVPC